MKAIQRINHNAAICEDGAGRQLIALGRGIGFGEMPHEVDLDVVTRTFYGIDSKYLAFIDEVDPEVLEFSAQLADIATGQLSYELSPNLPITLADHIQFAIKRAREHMVVSLPLEIWSSCIPSNTAWASWLFGAFRKASGCVCPEARQRALPCRLLMHRLGRASDACLPSSTRSNCSI